MPPRCCPLSISALLHRAYAVVRQAARPSGQHLAVSILVIVGSSRRTRPKRPHRTGGTVTLRMRMRSLTDARISHWPARAEAVRAFVLLAACAACGVTGANRTADPPRFASYSTVLEASEIATAQVATLHDAITLLRPQFLASSGVPGRQPSVFVDGIYFGTGGDLRLLHAGDVERVQFLRGPDASIRFGLGHDTGAITVVTRHGRWP